MYQMPRLFVLRLIFLLLASSTLSAQQPVLPKSPVPVEITSLSSPQLLQHLEGPVVAYELLIANPSPELFKLESIVITDNDDVGLLTLAGAELTDAATPLFRSEATSDDPAEPLSLGYGERYIVYVWLQLADDQPRPDMLRHRLSLTYADHAQPLESAGPALAVHEDVVVIDAPVRGGYWRVGNGFANAENHRRYFVVDQKIMIPQRFGADFSRVHRENGDSVIQKFSDVSELSNNSFLAYGEPLFAVADGVVARVYDGGMPDNEIAQGPDAPMTLEQFAGNHVLLQIGPQQFAAYGHLKTGSIQVQEGEEVQRGAPIARIGNSGNTGSAHLHFHISDRPAFNSAEGMPFVFRRFELIDADFRFSADELPLPADGTAVENSLPPPRSIIRFPATTP